jgi:hypothetical protein
LGTDPIESEKKRNDPVGTNIQHKGEGWSRKTQPKTQDGVLPGKDVEQCAEGKQEGLCHFHEGLHHDSNPVDPRIIMGILVSVVATEINKPTTTKRKFWLKTRWVDAQHQ